MDILVQTKMCKRLLEITKLLQRMQEENDASKTGKCQCPISYEEMQTCLQQGVAIILCNNERQWFDARALCTYWKKCLESSETLHDPITRRPINCVDLWVVCHMVQEHVLLTTWRNAQPVDLPLQNSLSFRLTRLGVRTCRCVRSNSIVSDLELNTTCSSTDTLTKIMRDFPQETFLQEWLDCTPSFLQICPISYHTRFTTNIEKFLSND